MQNIRDTRSVTDGLECKQPLMFCRILQLVMGWVLLVVWHTCAC